MPSYTAEALALREGRPLSRTLTRQELKARDSKRERPAPRLVAAERKPAASPSVEVATFAPPQVRKQRWPRGAHIWTDDRIERLKRLRKDGLKAFQIAAELGVTENAVITQVYKLRAAARPGTSSFISTYWTPEVKKRMAAAAAALWRQPEFRQKQKQSSRGASVRLAWQKTRAEYAPVAKRYAIAAHRGIEGGVPVAAVMASQLDAVDYALSMERLPQSLQALCEEVLDGATIAEAAVTAGIAEMDLPKALAQLRAAFGH